MQRKSIWKVVKKNIGKHELHYVDSADAEEVIGKKSDTHDSKESSRFASRLKKFESRDPRS